MLFIFVSLLGVNVSAQAWCAKGATWYFDHWNLVTGAGYVKWTYLDNNAVIDNKVCNRFLLQTVGGRNSYGDHYFTYYNNKVVYYLYDGGSAYVYDTLYDFNAKPGDKWRMSPTYRPQCSAGKVNVLDTGSNIIAGQKLKWLKVQYTSSMRNFSDTIYERIGAIKAYPYHFFNVCPSGADNEWGGPLRCYSDNQILNYIKDYSQACDYYLDVSIKGYNSTDEFVRIQPNPTSALLNIELSNDLLASCDIKVFNLLGKECQFEKLKETVNGLNSSTSISINLSGLTPGIYQLSITQNGQLFVNKRIIKD